MKLERRMRILVCAVAFAGLSLLGGCAAPSAKPAPAASPPPRTSTPRESTPKAAPAPAATTDAGPAPTAAGASSGVAPSDAAQAKPAGAVQTIYYATTCAVTQTGGDLPSYDPLLTGPLSLGFGWIALTSDTAREPGKVTHLRPVNAGEFRYAVGVRAESHDGDVLVIPQSPTPTTPDGFAAAEQFARLVGWRGPVVAFVPAIGVNAKRNVTASDAAALRTVLLTLQARLGAGHVCVLADGPFGPTVEAALCTATTLGSVNDAPAELMLGEIVLITPTVAPRACLTQRARRVTVYGDAVLAERSTNATGQKQAEFVAFDAALPADRTGFATAVSTRSQLAAVLTDAGAALAGETPGDRGLERDAQGVYRATTRTLRGDASDEPKTINAADTELPPQ